MRPVSSLNRRNVVAGLAAASALAAAPVPVRAQTRKSSRDRLEEALARINDPRGEGKRACLTVYTEAARAAADAAEDIVRRAGHRRVYRGDRLFQLVRCPEITATGCGRCDWRFYRRVGGSKA